MKGFIQREWLAAKMSDREKLRAETETALQMFFVSPEDEISVSFSMPPLAMCCFKSLFLHDIDNLSRVLEQIASLKHRYVADICRAVSGAAFKCTSRNIFDNTRSKLVSLLEKNEFYAAASHMLAIEIINEETSDRENVHRAIDLMEKSAAKCKISKKTRYSALGYYMQAADWATAIGDMPRRDHLVKSCVSEIHDTLEQEDTRPWPEMEGHLVQSYVFCRRHDFFPEAARWAEKVGHGQAHSEFLEKAVQSFVEEAENREKRHDFREASYLYARAGEYGKQINDDKLRREMHEKAIDLLLAVVETDEKADEYRSASVGYATAADWARNIEDEKLRKQLYGKAIDLGVRYAESQKQKENYHEVAERYVTAADWAGNIGDDKLRQQLYSKAIDLQLRYAKGKQDQDDLHAASEGYADAADWAGAIGNDKLRKQLYREAIDLRLRHASLAEKKHGLSVTAADYVQAAKWAGAVGDKANVAGLHEKAASSLRESAETYENLASFLLNSKTLKAASALRDYFSNVEEEFAYFNKISSIVENCRWFFRGIVGMV